VLGIILSEFSGFVAYCSILAIPPGVIFSRNPRRVEDDILQTILSEFGVRDREGVLVFTAEDTRMIATTQADRLQTKTARVGTDIIRAASLYVREELVKAIEKVKAKLPPAMSKEDKLKIVEADEEVKFWEGAIYRVGKLPREFSKRG